MNVVVSQSMLVGKAVSYIQEKMVETGKPCSQALLDEAAMNFNLSPADACALERIFREKKSPRQIPS